MTFIGMASSSAHQRVVGDEGQAAGALDGHRHLTLVLGAVPRDPPRDDLPALGHEVLQHRLVLEVGVAPLLGAEAAHLLAAEAAASAALLVVATRPTAAARAVAPRTVSVSELSSHVLLPPGWPAQASSGASSSRPSPSMPSRGGPARSGAGPRASSTSPASFTSSWTGRLSGSTSSATFTLSQRVTSSRLRRLRSTSATRACPPRYEAWT